jgi:hypothetical protein
MQAQATCKNEVAGARRSPDTPAGQKILPGGGALAERTYRVRIEGHTDNKPIHNAQFSDNRDPSTARATELIRLLIVKYGFAPERLSAAGYAEYHPVNSNHNPEALAQNRRVDVVILGHTSMKRAGPSVGVAQSEASPTAPTAVLTLPKPSPAIPETSPPPR